MSSEIKVSILCLAYNHEKYIRKTLDGFVAQKTDFAFEVLVHDDASTDDTAAIIREYAQKYSFIKPVFQVENQYSKGVGITRSILLPRAKGTYIAFCEGDDYWTHEGKLQLQVDYMDANPDCAMCCHSFHKIRAEDESTIGVVRTLEFDGDLSPEQAIIYNKPSQLATQMFRKEVIFEMPNIFYGVGVGDYPMLLRAASWGRVHFFEKDMAAYRVASVGSWTARVYRDTNKQLKHWEKIKDFLKRYDEYCERRFHDAIKTKLDMIDFSCALLLNDYKRARECKSFMHTPMHRKAIIVIGCYFPRLACGVDKIICKMKG